MATPIAPPASALLEPTPSSLTQISGPSRLLVHTAITAIVNSQSPGLNRRSHAPSTSSHKMPPKFDPSETKVITLRATGGEVGASSALAPKVSSIATKRRE